MRKTRTHENDRDCGQPWSRVQIPAGSLFFQLISMKIQNANIFLGKTVKAVIDRPLGSKHPKHEFIYPINYGFIPNTKAKDGEELDAYVLGVFNPLREFKGKCIAVIRRLNDDDDKLVLALQGKKYSDDQIKALTEFQERFFKSQILRK